MCFRPPEAYGDCQELICPECGSENAPGETKCIFCGAALPTNDECAIASPAAPSAPNTPGASNAPVAPPKQ